MARASAPPDHALIEARELLAASVAAFPGNLPMAKAMFGRLVLEVAGEAVATGLADAGVGQQRSSHEVVVALIDVVGKFSNPWLALRCLPIAFSMPSADEDETQLAAEFGVTKGCVSAICVKICQTFGVPPGRGMKKEKARAAYATRQLGKRARPLPAQWVHRGIFASLRAA